MIKIVPPSALFIIIALLIATLTGCGNKSNALSHKPLLAFTPERHAQIIWQTKIGNGNAGQPDLTLTPTVYKSDIYTTSFDGTMRAVAAKNGEIIWSTKTDISLTSPPGVNSEYVIAGSLRGKLIAIDRKAGQVLWTAPLPSSLFAKPIMDHKQVYTQTHDGSVSAYATETGKQSWTQKLPIPDLILIGNSGPVIYQDLLLAGTASASLWGLHAKTGEKRWDNPVALPQSGSPATLMVDINATPLIQDNTLYVATFQGNLICFDLQSGVLRWQKKASIFDNMNLSKDALFTTDSSSHIIVYNIKNGEIFWQKNLLQGRKISAPLYHKNKVFVGDYAGYLHIFEAKTGQYLDRLQLGGDGIRSQPRIAGEYVVIQTNDGNLIAIQA